MENTLYGEEWKKEISKHPKAMIIEMLATSEMECELLKKEIEELTKSTYHDR